MTFRRVHVHVQIVGLNRSLSFTGPSIVKQVITPLDRCPLLKLSTSMTLIRPPGKVVNERSGESGLAEKEVVPPLDRVPCSFLDQSVLEERTAGSWSDVVSQGDPFVDGGKSIGFALIYLSALQGSANVVPGSPDVVVVLRPDIEIRGRLWVAARALWMFILARYRNVSAMLPAWGNYGGYNDRFAILSGQAAAEYLTRLDSIPQWHETGQPFDPESFLKFVMKDRVVKKSIYTPMVRIRIGGRAESRDLAFFTEASVKARFRNRTMSVARSIRSLFRRF